jgi:hypothetical protein
MMLSGTGLEGSTPVSRPHARLCRDRKVVRGIERIQEKECERFNFKGFFQAPRDPKYLESLHNIR